ncbi:MAG TPA: thioredoxin-like domain-containing protein [Patescibacteria group bacterium]|nr:thioredoxin-like domain-containing protein [Patescibacteria group bacterium]
MRHAVTVLLFLALLLPAAPARAANGYDALFGAKNEWLNAARPLTAADAKGRMVLLDFWTYGCINCMQVVPDLEKLEHEFGERLLIIGVHSAKFAGEKGSARILAAAKRFGLEHPVINDASFDVWDAFAVNAWPTLILLDTEGNETVRYAGEGHYKEIRTDISNALAGHKNNAATKLSELKAANENTGTLNFPGRLGFAPDTPWGELLFVADSGHNRLLGLTLDGKVKVTIGSGAEGFKNGGFEEASFNQPRGFGVAKDGIYIADTLNHAIRFADFRTRNVSTVAGTGQQGYDRRIRDANALDTRLASPWDAKLLEDGRTLVIAMAGLHQLWTLDTVAGTVSALAGTGKESIDDGNALSASLSQPSGISVARDAVYFVDAETSSLRVLKDGKVRTLIGTGLFDFGLLDGAYPRARMQHAQGLDANGGRVVIADTYNNALRLYDISSGKLSTLPLEKGAVEEPGDVLQLNGKIFVADTNHHRIVTVDPVTGKTAPLAIKP